MFKQAKWLGSVLGVVAVGMPIAACSSGFDQPIDGDGTEEFGEEFDESSQEIRNGTVANPWSPNSPDPTYAKAIVSVSTGCSATVVQPSWVLSAKHCAVTPGAKITSRRPILGNVVRTVDVVVPHEDPANEAVMVHVSAPFTDIPQVSLYTGQASQILGQTVRLWGYGAKAYSTTCSVANPTCPAGDSCNFNFGRCLTPSAELRYGDLVTKGYGSNPYAFATSPNALGQQGMPGDSGGPAFIGTKLAGINWAGSIPGDNVIASVPGNRELISVPSRVKYTVGDFDGNGLQDVIITNTFGSFWYYSTGTNQWDTSYQRPDLPIHNVIFTTGNFNGDAKTDLIITTPTGSYWYYGKSIGQWDFAQTRGDLPLVIGGYPNATPRFTVGDFNADGKSDYIVQTLGGAYWYYSSQAGVFNQSYSRANLSTTAARFTAGKFDDDNDTDLIVTTTNGSVWNYSNGINDWYTYYSRGDLTLGNVEFTVGNFNETTGRNQDVIVTSASGSSWLYSNGVSFDSAYNRTDLPMGSVSFKVADFDGDKLGDMIISTPTGSYWYYSQGPHTVGNWNPAYTRTDLPLYKAKFVTGDFNGGATRRSDVVITTATGSYWYLSTGLATWDTTYQRADLPL